MPLKKLKQSFKEEIQELLEKGKKRDQEIEVGFDVILDRVERGSQSNCTRS